MTSKSQKVHEHSLKVFWIYRISVYLMLFMRYASNSCVYCLDGRNSFWEESVVFHFASDLKSCYKVVHFFLSWSPRIARSSFHPNLLICSFIGVSPRSYQLAPAVLLSLSRLKPVESQLNHCRITIGFNTRAFRLFDPAFQHINN